MFLASYRAIRDIAFRLDQVAMAHRLRDIVPDTLISLRHHRTWASSPRLTPPFLTCRISISVRPPAPVYFGAVLTVCGHDRIIHAERPTSW